MFMPIEFHRRISFVATIALISTLSTALAGCSEEKSETADVVRPVKVVEIAQADAARQLSYSGAVRARTEMNLGFRVSGKIVERIVNVGDRVNVGDLLARIDATDYELAVRSATANLEAAERQVETVELVRDRAKQLLARKFASQAQFDQAVTHLAQPREVELGVAVGAADAPCLRGREHAVGADDLARGFVAHQQVLAEVVEQVDVVAGHGRGKACAHFAGKHFVAQALGGADFILVARPADFDAGGVLRGPRR